MTGKKICITADCACDLSEEVLKKYGVDQIYFYIETDTGRFRDVDEITAQNIFEYLEKGGHKCVTKTPPMEEYIDFFNRKLRFCDEIIHISMSSKVGSSVRNATNAASQLGAAARRIHVFDSEHLSTGMGYMVLHAAEMAAAGHSSAEIISALEELRSKVSTTFIARNADYLFHNEKVNKSIKILCNMFNIHPVLEMKEGSIKLKSFQMGDYEKSALRYIQKELKNPQTIDPARIFITHAGCTISDLKMIRREVDKLMAFDSVMVMQASAAISGNSGPRTFGILFVKK